MVNVTASCFEFEPQSSFCVHFRKNTLGKGMNSLVREAGIEIWLTITPIQDSTTQPRGNQCKWRKFKRLCITFVFVYIYPPNYYRELNSFEEHCFPLVATITSFVRELNPTGVGEHIYSHPQTVSFYQNSSVWLDRLDSRPWDRNLADYNANPRFYHSGTSQVSQWW